jgi:hypothetical protein
LLDASIFSSSFKDCPVGALKVLILEHDIHQLAEIFGDVRASGTSFAALEQPTAKGSG